MVCRLVCLENWRELSLCHPFWRLYYNLDPGLSVVVDGVETPLEPEQVVAIPPMCNCTSKAVAPARQFYIHFTASEPFDRVVDGVYAVPASGETRRAVAALLDGAGQAEFDTLDVLSLCLQVLRAIPQDRLLARPYGPKVRQAIAAMRANLASPLCNPALARQVHMNTNAFILLFRRETGQPPQRWYLQLRLRRAALLLAHGDLSIDEIARATGFCDRSHFSKAFRRYHQLGPATYRCNVRQSG